MLIGLDARTLAAPRPAMRSSSAAVSFPGHLNGSPPSLGQVPKLSTVLSPTVLLAASTSTGTAPPPTDCLPRLLRQRHAVYLSTNPVQHQHTKHVEIDLHFVREKVAIGVVRVLHVPTTSQYADVFTKGLPSSVFTEFRSSLNVRCIDVPTAGGVRINYCFM